MNIVNLEVTWDVLLPTRRKSSAPYIGDVGAELSPAGARGDGRPVNSALTCVLCWLLYTVWQGKKVESQG